MIPPLVTKVRWHFHTLLIRIKLNTWGFGAHFSFLVYSISMGKEFNNTYYNVLNFQSLSLDKTAAQV